MKKYILIALFVLNISPVNASGTYTGLISKVQIGGDHVRALQDIAYIFVEEISNPSCIDHYKMQVDLSTFLGRAQLSTALAAYTTQNEVRIVGTASCFNEINETEKVERLRTIRLQR